MFTVPAMNVISIPVGYNADSNVKGESLAAIALNARRKHRLCGYRFLFGRPDDRDLEQVTHQRGGAPFFTSCTEIARFASSNGCNLEVFKNSLNEVAVRLVRTNA